MITGILLAAGRGARFDPAGQRNKLLQRLSSGEEVAVAAARNLGAAVTSVIAVVAPGSEQLADRLRENGCEVGICNNAGEGMAASLVRGLSQARHADGWIIALADMPFVKPATIRELVCAVEQGAAIAAPFVNGKRGNPVAFGRVHMNELLALRGDEGARRLLNKYEVTPVAVDDPGILRDIDTPVDLNLPD